MTSLTLCDATVTGRTRPRLDRVSLTLSPHQLTVLVGPNGAGKSTLLQVLAGAISLDAGAVEAQGRDLQTLNRRDRAGLVAWLPQHVPVEIGMTAVEVVAAARYRYDEPHRTALARAREALDRAGASPFADRAMPTLSGGEVQRVRIAALWAQESAWWLLDEPANHLDPAVRADLISSLQERIAAGGGVLLVTHDLQVLDALPDARIVGLHEGQIAFDTDGRSPTLPDAIARLFGVPWRGSETADRAAQELAEPHSAPSARYPRAIGLIAAALGCIAIAPWIGAPLEPESATFVLTELRIPRAVLGATIGGTLALTGAAFQTVLENPLATPSTIGTTAGASLGALAILVLWPGIAIGTPGIALGAFAGALGVSLAIAALARMRAFRTEELLLAGIAISLGAGAAITGLQIQADAATTLASVRWSLGSLAIVGYGKVLAALPFAILGGLGVLSQQRSLQAMTSGTDRASTVGVDVVRTRTIVLGAGSLAVAGCVAVAGPIAFVGLVVPHLVRLIAGGAPRRLLWLSLVAGAGFLPLADALARVAWPGREIPVGVLTAALGAPTLFALLWRRR